MKRINFIIHIFAALVLTACNLGGDVTEVPAESQLPVVQTTPTLTLADKVAIELASQVDTSIQYNTVGQVVKFKFTIKMNRNDSADVPPNLTFTGATPVCPAINTIGDLNERFDTGESMDCSFDYPLTQADLDKASVSFPVTVNIYSVNSNTATATVATIPSKLLTLTKTADPASYYQIGQTIKFNYTIKNSGSSPLGPGQFTVTDSAVNNNTAFNCGDANASIASGASLTWLNGKIFEKEEAGAMRLDIYARAVERMAAARAKHAQADVFDVDYRDLIADKLGTVRAIYKHFGLALSETTEHAMREFVASNPQGKHGKHAYSSEEFGLSDDIVRARFANYIARHNLG